MNPNSVLDIAQQYDQYTPCLRDSKFQVTHSLRTSIKLIHFYIPLSSIFSDLHLPQDNLIILATSYLSSLDLQGMGSLRWISQILHYLQSESHGRAPTTTSSSDILIKSRLVVNFKVTRVSCIDTLGFSIKIWQKDFHLDLNQNKTWASINSSCQFSNSFRKKHTTQQP